jgi:hypothetical protein
MNRFQRCALCIGLALLGCAAAFAEPPLTVVQDILFNADGTTFNGLVTISWQSFEASDTSNIPASSISTQVINGLLRVQLVPTTNALSPSSYTVVYNSGGSTQFTENWAVPPSNVPLPVSAVRISGSGTVIGGATGTGQNTTTTTVTIADVTGLTAALNLRPSMGAGFTISRAAIIDASGAIDGASGTLSDCLHVDGTSGACGTSSSGSTNSLTFVDGETPGGTVNGVNAGFTLANAPLPASSLALYRNGLLQEQGVDYSLSNSSITFLGSFVPQPADVLTASYRINVSIAGVTFVDEEVPAGTVDGSNTSFTLSQAPSPVASLSLYRNGVLQKANRDYTLSGTGIVFQPGLAPQPGDILLASYRVTVGSN